MPRRIYAVILDEENDVAIQKLDKKYGSDFLRLNGTAALVRTNDIARAVASAAGIGVVPSEDKAPKAEGIVLQLGPSHAGYTFQSRWEWIKSEDAQAE